MAEIYTDPGALLVMRVPSSVEYFKTIYLKINEHPCSGRAGSCELNLVCSLFRTI